MTFLLVATLAYLLVLVLTLAVGLTMVALRLAGAAGSLEKIGVSLRQAEQSTAPFGGDIAALNGGLAAVAAGLPATATNLAALDHHLAQVLGEVEVVL